VPALSVIVLNLNRKDLLAKCLDSLDTQTFGDFEVVAVDNGSVDGSIGLLQERKAEGEGLKIVDLGRNLGFDGGCNAGLNVAAGEYIATLNNDAEADPRWLEELVRPMKADPRVGMCASKIVFLAEPGRIDKVGHLIYLDGLNHGRGSGQLDQGQFDREEDVLFPDGAAALYRREMLEEVGRFDERFFAYGDDCDLGLRGRRAGWSSVYVPTAIVRHVHSATAGEFSPHKAFLIERNRIWVALKNFPVLLLLASPLFTLMRFVFHAYGALFQVGSSGRFSRDSSKWKLVEAMLKAYVSAVIGAAGILKSRSEIARFKRLSDGAFIALLWRHRISVKDLTLRG